MPMITALRITLATALLSCTGPTDDARSFAVGFIVESDPGVRLGGARVFVDGELAGESDSTGRAQVEVEGQVGQRLLIEHRCPAGYEAPREPAALKLSDVEAIDPSGSPAVEMTLVCRPKERLAAFVVRTRNAPSVAVLLDGTSVARTNRLGVAHLSTSGAPGTEYTIELDTRDHPRLQPQRPRHVLILPDMDELFVLDQAFAMKSKPRRAPRRRPRITKIE